MTASTAPIASAVTEKVQQITQSDAFKKWAEEETLRAPDLVILNNSFLFREGIRTTKKSSLYLGLDVSDDGVSLPPKIVASRSNINVSFKRAAARTASTYVSTDLKTAVEREIENLGEIVFALAGTVGDREAVTVPLSSVAEFEALRFDPTQTEPVVFDESTLSFRQLEEIDELWTAVLQRAESEGINLGVDAASGFDKASQSSRKKLEGLFRSGLSPRTVLRFSLRSCRGLTSRSPTSRPPLTTMFVAGPPKP